MLSLCAAALFIRRRRRRAHHSHRGGIPLGPRTESDLAVINLVRSRPHSQILYDNDKGLPPGDNASVLSSTSTLPVAAEIALASMAEEMQALRRQIKRLEGERESAGVRVPDDTPPEYAPV